MSRSEAPSNLSLFPGSKSASPDWEAEELGFLARVLVQATLPHRRPKSDHFERRNGRFTLTLQAPPSVGLPYGVYPRLALTWITTTAVQTRCRRVELGPTFTSFMRRIGVPATTGKRGTSRRLRDQLHRLFSCSIRWSWANGEGVGGRGCMIAGEHRLWWDPEEPGEVGSGSVVTLSRELFDELVAHPVPVDLDALRSVKGSAMALDLYAWLKYRASYMRPRSVVVPWHDLGTQLGARYGRERDFRRKVLAHLGSVEELLPGLRIVATDGGLELCRRRRRLGSRKS